MDDGEGQTRQRVWERGARDAWHLVWETVPEVVRKVRVSGKEDGDEVIGFCLALLPSLQGWICGFVGHKFHRQPLREKVLVLSALF
jgi:hypothetical protein